jgi:ABC-type spermidine/putrescine transport system permease subunit II
MAEDHIAARRAPDRSHRARIAVSVLGIVCCVIMTLTFQEKSLGLLFGLAFSLAWWSEVARRLPVLMALGAAVILAGAAFVRVLGGHKAARQSHGGEHSGISVNAPKLA